VTSDSDFVSRDHQEPKTKVKNSIAANDRLICVSSVANCDGTVAIDGDLIRRNPDCRTTITRARIDCHWLEMGGDVGFVSRSFNKTGTIRIAGRPRTAAPLHHTTLPPRISAPRT